MKPFRLGEIAVDSVVETARWATPLAELLPASDPKALALHASWLEPRFARLEAAEAFLSFRTLVVRTPQHTVLVDTCVGNDKPRGGFAPFHMLTTDWLARLRASGVTPESVDYVLCTHMHSDHIGWNTRLEDGRWVPTFPRARYLFARTEFERSRAAFESGAADFRAPAYADSVLPVVESGQALVVESDHALGPHLRLEPAPGHTPGNVVIHLRSGASRAVLCGDVFHHPIQVVYPEWSAAFCEDPVLSARTRRRFVEQHADTATIVVPAHFPPPAAGRIVSAGDRWRFAFAGD